jgi:hypothetical protein
MERSQPSWEMLCAILRNHNHDGHSCEQTVNRLWRKKLDPNFGPPIAPDMSSVYFEAWTLDRLWAQIPPKDIVDLLPKKIGAPPIIVRWKGRDYRIDGRRRINQLKRDRAEGPHQVLILDIGDV